MVAFSFEFIMFIFFDGFCNFIIFFDDIYFMKIEYFDDLIY